MINTYRTFEDVDFSALKGKILKDIKIHKDNDEISFFTEDNQEYVMSHQYDCCETVEIEDVCGSDLSALIGTPILKAEVIESNSNPIGVTKECQDSFTWTFYTLATIKGHTVIRWYGESNGYYSETADFRKVICQLSHT